MKVTRERGLWGKGRGLDRGLENPLREGGTSQAGGNSQRGGWKTRRGGLQSREKKASQGQMLRWGGGGGAVRRGERQAEAVHPDI